MTEAIQVPNQSFPASANQTLNLHDFAGKTIVLYFYPKDNTPGCTNESIAFRDNFPAFQELGVMIIGVSRDSVKSHNSFIAKHQFPFPLISDSEETLCKHFDVIREKNMYGRKVLGIERSTFIIDGNGQVIKAYRKVKVKGHVEEVLHFCQSN